jgi:hypothetical protein
MLETLCKDAVMCWKPLPKIIAKVGRSGESPFNRAAEVAGERRRRTTLAATLDF